MASGVQWHQIIKVVQIYPAYVLLVHYFIYIMNFFFYISHIFLSFSSSSSSSSSSSHFFLFLLFEFFFFCFGYAFLTKTTLDMLNDNFRKTCTVSFQ